MRPKHLQDCSLLGQQISRSGMIDLLTPVRPRAHQEVPVLLHTTEELFDKVHIPVVLLEIRPLGFQVAVGLWSQPSAESNHLVVLLGVDGNAGSADRVLQAHRPGFVPPLSTSRRVWYEVLEEWSIETCSNEISPLNTTGHSCRYHTHCERIPLSWLEHHPWLLDECGNVNCPSFLMPLEVVRTTSTRITKSARRGSLYTYSPQSFSSCTEALGLNPNFVEARTCTILVMCPTH